MDFFTHLRHVDMLVTLFNVTEKTNYIYEFRGLRGSIAEGSVIQGYDPVSLGQRIPDERNRGQLQLLMYCLRSVFSSCIKF